MRYLRYMLIKALMIDVDGVIVVHPHPNGWSANLERDLGLSASQLDEEFFKPHFGDIIRGRAKLHDRLGLVLAEIAPNISSTALARYWFEQDSFLNHDLLNQLAEIRQRGIELHLATVQEHERADYLWRTLGFRDRFDAMHYAADLGCVKPSSDFYAAIEERSGFQAKDLFFIDDKIENVEAALLRGWNAAVWNGSQRLVDLLVTAGIDLVP